MGAQGQDAIPEQMERQTIQTEGPMMPGAERPMMDINQVTQEGQDAVEGSGYLGGNMTDDELAFRMAMAPTKSSRGIGASLMSSRFGADSGDFDFDKYMASSPETRAKYDRFKGRFDYSGGGHDPAFVKEHKYAESLSPEEQERYWGNRRMQWRDMGGFEQNMVTGETRDKTLAPKDQPKNVAEKVDAQRGTEREWDRKAAWPKARNSHAKFKRTQKNQANKIKRAREGISNWSAGFGGTMISQLPGTPAKNIERLLGSIQARLAFTELENMRASSPTGGAVGQLTDAEREALADAVEPINQDQTVNDLLDNLGRLQNYMDELGIATESAFAEDWSDYGQGRKGTNTRVRKKEDTAPNGVKWAD